MLRVLPLCLVLTLLLARGNDGRAADPAPPNIIVILADDLGYGDLGVYGHPTIRTPALDRLAAEGQKWTSFYAAANVCTPSRAALLTGRWPVRSGMASEQRLVLTARAAGGLPPGEITLAELLQARGYVTAAVGKWHLGQQERFLPTRQGFNSFFGTPYSNDEALNPAWRRQFARRDYWNGAHFRDPRSEYWDIPLLRDETELERPVDQTTLPPRYADELIRFVRANRSRPFFLYFAPNMPHVPLFASAAFRGRSARGPYGDVVEELDDTIGRLVTVLREEGLDRRTLVIFTSDNGPWLIFGNQGGSAGLLRDGKGTTWEGGHRVPAIFWWPGRIAPGVEEGIGTQLDLLPTLARLAGAPLPADTRLDGVDLGPALFAGAASPRQSMLYFRGPRVFAYREGPYKIHLRSRPGFGLQVQETVHEPPLLYHLEHDPSERHDLAADHPEVVARLRAGLDRELAGLTFGPDQLAEQLPAKP
jgi:arylsulfatase A